MDNGADDHYRDQALIAFYRGRAPTQIAMRLKKPYALRLWQVENLAERLWKKLMDDPAVEFGRAYRAAERYTKIACHLDRHAMSVISPFSSYN